MPRFPTGCIASVERSIGARLKEDAVGVLVCAAACGSDLLALSAASALGIRRRIVLPFDVATFKSRSVTDRPGDYPWSEMYDRFISESENAGDLVLLGYGVNDADAFEKTNVALLDEAIRLAREGNDGAEAIVVWDGDRRTRSDYTEHFAREASLRNIAVKTVQILSGNSCSTG